MTRFIRSLAAATLLTALAGCGGSELGCVPVTGTVQFSDGTKVESYKIRNIALVPNSSEGGARKASGEIKPDGTFSLMTQKPDDGAVPGKYLVSGEIWKNYPATPADMATVWTFDPATVEVVSGMEPLKITIKKAK